MSNILGSRREVLFLYDIKMGNPNGDPDENRPRVLPDGTHYVTDVRLKRFIRDFLKSQGKKILVDNIEGKTTNLTGRVAEHLKSEDKKEAQGKELLSILLSSFIDARLFGSSFAFKKQDGFDLKPDPKTMTGAFQFNMGEVLHRACEIDIHGTTIFGSDEKKSCGTFTAYYALRYALIGFNGIANEHSARISMMTEEDYTCTLEAIWKGVRANTRTKTGQVPRLLIDIEYKKEAEFQFGNLLDYVSMEAVNNKPEKDWSSPMDYSLNLELLCKRLSEHAGKIEKVKHAVSPDIKFSAPFVIDGIEIEKMEMDK